MNGSIEVQDLTNKMSSILNALLILIVIDCSFHLRVRAAFRKNMYWEMK
jgi:hypothetical protein